MPCSTIKLPGGGFAIVRHAKGRFPRCTFCPAIHLRHANEATLLCDFVVGKTLGGAEITCDTPVCSHYAKHVGPDKDFCPKHSR
jgi:hypothetical protein